MENFNDLKQKMYDTYINLVKCWLMGEDFLELDTGDSIKFEDLNKKLQSFENDDARSLSTQFRSNVFIFYLEYKKLHNESPKWDSDLSMKNMIEDKI